MFKNLILVLSFFLWFQVESQNTTENNEIIDNSISEQLYTKCFENLNQGAEIFEKYPTLKENLFCSIIRCSILLAYNEKDIQFAGENRLIGIATQLFREGNPVYLTAGMENYLWVEKENKNLEDDNHIVYISYGECTNPYYLNKAAEIVNKQTKLLIKQAYSK